MSQTKLFFFWIKLIHIPNNSSQIEINRETTNTSFEYISSLKVVLVLILRVRNEKVRDDELRCNPWRDSVTDFVIAQSAWSSRAREKAYNNINHLSTQLQRISVHGTLQCIIEHFNCLISPYSFTYIIYCILVDICGCPRQNPNDTIRSWVVEFAKKILYQIERYFHEFIARRRQTHEQPWHRYRELKCLGRWKQQ